MKIDKPFCLAVIGETEKEPAYPELRTADALHLTGEFFIAVIGPMLIDDISDKPIICGRLYPKSPTTMYPAQPDNGPTQTLHRCFSAKISIFFKLLKIEEGNILKIEN
jgi:hypothetical protein